MDDVGRSASNGALDQIPEHDQATVTALGGVRVLDFTRHIAGPCATQFLADYGADVIKVEGLPHGDGARRTGTVFQAGESGLFLVANHGKRSLALDLRSPDVREAIENLIRQSDVLIENFRPGVAAKLGIGYERCCQLNPRLIYVSISAFGQTGPLSELPGTDPVVQAMSGVMSVTGEPGGGPVLVGVPVADFTSAMMGAQSVMLALLARHKTGRGQKVELSMLSALISSWTTRLAAYWGEQKDPSAHGSAHSAVTPYQAYKTENGYAVAGVWGAGEGWTKFCDAVGRNDLVDDFRFSDNIRRTANKAALNAILEPIFLSKTTEAWAEIFAAKRALFGPVYKFSEILSHPQVVASGLVTTVDHPKLGTINQLGPVIQLSDTPGQISRHPPLLGEHTEELLIEAGLSPAAVQRLFDVGAAGRPAQSA